MSGNAALGGLTAALVQTLRGGSFWEALRDGAVGGAFAYAGKRIAVEDFWGAGLLGREVAAVGASVVRNASDGRATLARLVLPVGVARLYLEADSASGLPTRAHLKFDLPTFVSAVYFGTRPGSEFAAGASLSAGTPVFLTAERWSEQSWEGSQAAGALWLHGNPRDPYPEVEKESVFAHERVHVVQYDFGFLAWSDPMEGWIAQRLPGGAWVDRHLDLGLYLAPWALANHLTPHDQRPWEHEAHFLSGSVHRE